MVFIELLLLQQRHVVDTLEEEHGYAITKKVQGKTCSNLGREVFEVQKAVRPSYISKW